MNFKQIALIFIMTLSAAPAYAADITLSTVDIVWVLIAAVLVFFMQAGFALIESGSTRSKNSINVMMKNYSDVCVGTLIFWMLGYGLMFGNNPSGWFGIDHFMPASPSNSETTFILFQTLFAATAATICSGAMAERTQYRGYLVATCLICALIYPIFGSWVWGGIHGGAGWLGSLGFIDFAGSTVVHSVGAWCALAGIIIIGARTGRFSKTGEVREIPGHNLSLVALGGFILWLGWFGFNGGSSLSSEANLGQILWNTHLAATAGVISALISSYLMNRPLLLTTTVNGSLAGLVAITAGCATMSSGFAVITGLIGGLVYVAGERLLLKLQLDDVVGAIAVHGFAGAWGTLAAGMFVSGDLFNTNQIMVQLLGIATAFLWTFPVALLCFWLVKQVFGLRASIAHEQQGLDFSEHAEVGYPEFQPSTLFKKR